jgi:hypothetical protein
MKRHHGACGNVNVLALDPHADAAQCDCQTWNDPTTWDPEPGSGTINLRYRWVVRLFFAVLKKWTWLERNCKLQHPEEGESLQLNTFGRAHIKSSRPWHPGFMLYWTRTPCFEWREDFCTLRYGWHQAVLAFHGKRGFEVWWIWVLNQDIVRSEQDDYL